MKFNRNRMLALVASAVACGVAQAVPVIDGTLSIAEYGNPVVVQNNSTGWGDSTLGLLDFCNGSEMNNMFVAQDTSNLYVGFGGNIENGQGGSYNKFVIFIDNQSGGQNVIGSPVGTGDFGYLSGEPNDPKFQGFTFEPGFNADFAFNITNGDNNIFANYFQIGVAAGDWLGQGLHGNGNLINGNNNGVQATINNSNILGVTDVSADLAASVRTGAEFKIPFSLIGGNKCDIKVVALMTGGGGFISQQLLPGIGLGGTQLTNPSTVNLGTVPGMQMLWLYPSVSGTIVFNDYTATAPSSVDVEWYNGATLVMTTPTAVAANGTFKACGPTLGGNYTVRVKKSHWLGKVATANTTAGAITGVTLSLINGDVNEDNFVGFDDFDLLSASFNLSLGDTGYVANADLNGDDFVGFDDFDILSANFNTDGE